MASEVFVLSINSVSSLDLLLKGAKFNQTSCLGGPVVAISPIREFRGLRKEFSYLGANMLGRNIIIWPLIPPFQVYSFI
jgi:hypothetical protein